MTAFRALPVVVVLIMTQRALAAPTTTISPQERTFFEAKIRPALMAHCYRCHSSGSEVLEGGLGLDSKAGWQTGGDSGEPAIVPGDPDKSRLIRAIRHEGELPMPPDEKLPDDVVADFVEWVKRGAPDPRDEPSVAHETSERGMRYIGSGLGGGVCNRRARLCLPR